MFPLPPSISRPCEKVGLKQPDENGSRSRLVHGGDSGKPLNEFAHLILSKVEFREVASRTATSSVLLVVLLGGILTPTGLCVLMCQRHAKTEIQTHCSEPSDAMPGMVHDNSAMNRPAIQAMSLAMMSPSCQPNCVTAERLNTLREVVPQGTAIESGPVVLDATAELQSPSVAEWSSHGGPPAPPPVYSASFNILRI